MKFKAGETYQAKLSSQKPYKIHILSVVDERQVVFKWYGRHKKRWFYEVMKDVFLEDRIVITLPKQEITLCNIPLYPVP